MGRGITCNLALPYRQTGTLNHLTKSMRKKTDPILSVGLGLLRLARTFVITREMVNRWPANLPKDIIPTGQ